MSLLTIMPTPLLFSSLATSVVVILSSIFSQLLLLYQCPWAKLSIFVNKVYLNTALLLHSCIVYSFFQTTTAELAVTVETIGPEGLKYLFSLRKKLTDSCLKISRLELCFFCYLNFKNPVLQPSSPPFFCSSLPLESQLYQFFNLTTFCTVHLTFFRSLLPSLPLTPHNIINSLYTFLNCSLTEPWPWLNLTFGFLHACYVCI